MGVLLCLLLGETVTITKMWSSHLLSFIMRVLKQIKAANAKRKIVEDVPKGHLQFSS